MKHFIRLVLTASLLFSSTTPAQSFTAIDVVVKALPIEVQIIYALGAKVILSKSDAERAYAFKQLLDQSKRFAIRHQHLVEQIPDKLDEFLKSPLGVAVKQWVESSENVQFQVEQTLKKELLGIDSNYIQLR